MCIATSAIAQKNGQWTTPFSASNVTKEFVDGKSSRTFHYRNPRISKASIGLSYGLMPITSFGWWSNPIVGSKVSGTEPRNAEYTSCFGSVSAHANVYLNPWLELQVPFIYSHASGKLYNKVNVEESDFSEDWYTLMPNIKIIWVQNDILQAYSRVGIGVALVNRREHFNNASAIRADIAFAWQFSPIGIEVGKRVKFYAEAGFGQTGVVMAGVKFHFNSMAYDKQGNPKKIEKHLWYENMVR